MHVVTDLAGTTLTRFVNVQPVQAVGTVAEVGAVRSLRIAGQQRVVALVTEVVGLLVVTDIGLARVGADKHRQVTRSVRVMARGALAVLDRHMSMLGVLDLLGHVVVTHETDLAISFKQHLRVAGAVRIVAGATAIFLDRRVRETGLVGTIDDIIVAHLA